MAKQNYFYIKVRVSTEKELSKKQIDALVQAMDIAVESNTITETTIEETALDYEMLKTI